MRRYSDDRSIGPFFVELREFYIASLVPAGGLAAAFAMIVSYSSELLSQFQRVLI